MFDPTVVLDDSGEAVAVWQRAGNRKLPVIQSAARRPGAGWTEPVNISALGDHLKNLYPQIASTPGGEVIAVWTQFRKGQSVIQSAVRWPDGTWSKPIDISKTDGLVQFPEVAIDDAGEAVVVWETFFDEGDRVIQSATRAPSGVWSAPVSLTPRGEESEVPTVVMNGAGEVIASWDKLFGRFLGRDALYASSRLPGGNWSAPVKLTETHSDDEADEFVESTIAISPSGEAVALWERSRLPNGHGQERSIIQSVSRPPGGGWSTPVDVGKASFAVDPPALAVGPAGEAVAVWTREMGRLPQSRKALHHNNHHVSIESATRSPVGAWSAPTRLFRAGVSELRAPTIAIDDAGDAVTAWQNEQAAIQGASRPQGGGWSPANTLSRGRNEEALFPEVAVGQDGRAVVVWEASHGIVSSFGRLIGD